MPTSKRIQFSTAIEAPPAKVWETMLSDAGYRQWANAFAEGCYFEGSWETGSRIRFLAPSGEGMVSEIAESRPHEFLSIRHLGTFKDGVEVTESEEVRSWAPAYENYTFEGVPEGTRLVVDQDVAADWEEYLKGAWPKALAHLKLLCEAG